MEPNPVGLLFVKNQRDGGSDLVAHMIQAPPSTAMVVFPSREAEDIMNEPGWYLVRLTFPPGGNVAIAMPVTNVTLIEAARDMTDTFVVNS